MVYKGLQWKAHIRDIIKKCKFTASFIPYYIKLSLTSLQNFSPNKSWITICNVVNSTISYVFKFLLMIFCDAFFLVFLNFEI